jgi:hypothetical protein
VSEIDIISTAVIAAGQSLSAEADIGNKVLVGIVLPANWSAAAGGLSFQASVDGGVTWNEVTTAAGSAYVVGYTAGGGAYLAIDPTTLRGISSFKVRSGPAGAPVNQTNLVAIQLVTRMVF